MRHFVNIALVGDSSFFPGLVATILSLCQSSKNPGSLKIYVLDAGIPDTNWSWLSEKVAHQFPSDSPDLHRLSIQPSEFDQLPAVSRWSRLICCRFLLPELLQENKVIYLDSDLLVFSDLGEIWNNAANSPYPVAGVLNPDGSMYHVEFEPSTLSSLNIKVDDPYINSGVLYMNLDDWREDNLGSFCLDWIQQRKNLRFPDQAALNVIMRDRMGLLHPKWNRFTYLMDQLPWDSLNGIIHFVGPKPWRQRVKQPSVVLFLKFMNIFAPDCPGLKNETGSLSPMKLPNPGIEFFRAIIHGTGALWWGLLQNPGKVRDRARAASDAIKKVCNRNHLKQNQKQAFKFLDSVNFNDFFQGN